MTTPTGSPTWTRTANHTHFGGHLQKRNYLSKTVINPKTDVDASELIRAANNLAEVCRTAPKCIITFTCDDTGTNDPTVHYVSALFGEYTQDYDGGSPPTGFPSVTRSGDGDVDITFASSYSDAYSVAGAFQIDHAEGGVHGAGFGSVNCDIDATKLIVTVLITDENGSAELDRKVTVEMS